MFTFIETKLFTKLVQDYLSDEEYRLLQQALIINPDSGAVVKSSGGVRKIRWANKGRGKRGAYRVVYFVRRTNNTIWMLTMYPKNLQDSIPGHILRQIREEIENE